MATVAVSSVSPASTTPSSPVPRKRRRRAPTTGASEDCHTCRKRGSKCDRRRPYCSQCLDIGKECSGYRTTLTWGVGVASRGKLRGMTLPIAKPSTPPAQGSGTSTPTTKLEQSKPRARSHSATLQRGETPADSEREEPRKRLKLSPLKTNYFQQGWYSSGSSATSPAEDIVSSAWPMPRSYPYEFTPTPLSHSPHGMPYSAVPTSHPPSHLQLSPQAITSHPVQYDEHAISTSPNSLGSGGSVGPYNEGSWDMQVNFPPTPDSNVSSHDPFMSQNPTGSSYSAPPTNTPAYSQFGQVMSPEHTNSWSYFHEHEGSVTPTAQEMPHDFDFKVENQGERPTYVQHRDSKLDHQTNTSSWSDISEQTSMALTLPTPRNSYSFNNVFNLSPRLQYLLDYYSQAICPVLVAFDDDSNPYRKHIMHLAMENPGLQNALAALSTNNMRMKCLRAIPEHLKDKPHTAKAIISESIGSPTDEEQLYKAKSIEYLNKQLADPMRASDDSVLATLLILCLFHVCDSGFSKFKVQLLGVQKLLRLRGYLSQSTEFVDWVQMFFAWFDVMTAAVNDRETQVNGEPLELDNLASSLGHLEQFSGCDGRLFKLISRLGRLNLLSQGRPVRDKPDLQSSPVGPKPRDYYSLNSGIDANPAISPSDSRRAFWQEWATVRERLYAWQQEPYLSPSHTPEPGPMGDMHHISESFRFSALLYTERLAHPSHPASSQNLQMLVRQSLSHIDKISVNSCVTKFMLWPLFITGTECIEERHRNKIRERCREIQQESGFYNNVNGLECLERVWRDVDTETSDTPTSCGGQAFRWRKAMDRVDGEYIMI